MIQFHETVMGRQFFDGQLPKLIRAIERLSDNTERLADAVEKLNAKMEEKENGVGPKRPEN